MKILIISQYFWPEHFRINEIAEHLIQKGFKVDVLTGYPNYPEGKLYEIYKKNPNFYSKLNDINIFRVPIFLRSDSSKVNLFFNYFSFVLSAIIFGTFKLRNKKYDLIFTFGTSPITAAIPSIYFSKLKNAKNVLWVLDIWPDILKDLNAVKNSFLYKILISIVKFIYLKTDKILIQSKGFNDIVKKYSIFSDVSYFPAWPEINPETNNDKNISAIKNEEKYFLEQFNKYSFKIVFTGNIGEAQNFNNILKAANILKMDKRICWIIVGTGRKIIELKEIKNKLKINNLYFLGLKEFSLMPIYHNNADILLVSLLGHNSLSTTIPGKLQTYLKTNKYILGFIKGEAETIIKESKSGEVVDPNDHELLAKRILYLANNPDIFKEVIKKKYGENYVNANFNKNSLLNKLTEIFKETINDVEDIKLVTDTNFLPYSENFSLSGLNLAYLGYLTADKIKLKKHVYHWPDGIFYRRFFKKENIRKIPGREIVSKLILPSFIERIYVFGSLSTNSKLYLMKTYNKELIYIALPFAEIDFIYKNFCKFKFTEKDLIIITLPTPKQEQLSQLIANDNKHFKIICIGGAISMASGDEKLIPKFFEDKGLEFIWRLRTDTKRRLFRLFYTAFYYLYGETIFFFSKIRTKIVKK